MRACVARPSPRVAAPEDEAEILAQLPGLLDRVDAWIEQGVVGGAHLNVADFMIAPSLALILYRPDVSPLFQGRPALELVDRLLPEPVAAQAGSPPNVAILPQPGRSWFDTAPADQGAQLRALAVDGLLPPYDEWFPPGVLEELESLLRGEQPPRRHGSTGL